MPSSQSFASAYKLSAAPTNGGSFTLQFSGNGGNAPRFNVSVTDSATSDTDTNVLGNVAKDAVTTTGFNNTNAQYWGKATVTSGGSTYHGIIIYDPNGGGSYWFLSGASSLSSTGSTVANQSTPGVNTWTLAGTGTPSAPTFTVSDNAGSVQSGNLAAGGSTDDATLTLSGTAGAGATVRIYDGSTSGSPIGTVTADASGAWSYTTSALSQGAHTLNVTQTETGGTTSSTTGFAVTVDTTAPSAPTIGSATDNVGAVTGTLNAGGSTDDTTPTLNIALPGNAVAGDTVKVLNGATEVGSHVLTAADITAGSVSITTSAITGDGAKTLTATITDAAGNTSGAGGFGYTLDTTPPASGGTVTLSDPGGDGIQYGEANAYAFDVGGVSDGTATVTFTSSGGGTPIVVSGLGNGTHTVDLGGLPSGTITAAISTSDAAGNATAGTGGSIGAVTCFYPGTRIATPGGEAAVEALRAGDLVLTADGRAAPVRWVGRQTVSTRFADPLRVLPIRVRAGALAENVPARDLLVSPAHALLVGGVLAQAGALVNGTSIARERGVPEVFTYWHVELAEHALILAEGAPAESFVDNVDREAFDNWDEHLALAGGGGEAPAVPEMDLPRAKAARQVPAAVRALLAERADALLGGEAAAA